MLELTESIRALCAETARGLRGSARRLFMARTVRALGTGGQSRAERELGWYRGTIRQGLYELASGVTCVGAFGLRGRKPAEARLPHLLEDIRAMADSQSQAAPSSAAGGSTRG